MSPKTIVVFAVLIALYSMPESGEKRNTGLMTETAMRELIGGHGGAGCDECAHDHQTITECAHFTATDPCKSGQCIVTTLMEDSCNPSTQSDCWTELDPDLDYLRQELRIGSNCSSNNPSSWDVWKIHYYGSSCSTRNYMTRCEMTSGSCDGTLIETTLSANAINCI